MRTNILVSRISRLVETAGESVKSGDGAALAEEYAAAVDKVNNRLESVIAAADANSISDAIRLVSEDPPLLEEISTLDFFQLQDWENLCDMNEWRIPPKIDKQMMERAAEIGEAKDAIAPFLSMYKKAVRVNNVRLAVKSLRRLADLDSSQDWSRNLAQSERQLQSLIVDEFTAAESAGENEACDSLARELLDGTWKDGLSAAGVSKVRGYWEKREAEKRDVEGREDIEILKKCLNGKWDRKLALLLVQSIDKFVEKGWKIPAECQSVVGECRARCAHELEEEEREQRWREVNETLHAAIQREDCAAIRDALSVPEFLDRDPMDDMLDQSQDILDHAEAMQRRKTRLIAMSALLAVLSVLGVSGWWLKNKMFVGRCEDEAARLANFDKQSKENPRHAINGMAECLDVLKKNEPEVYAYPKVAQFETRLKALVAENLSRTNQIASLLAELERMNAQSWSNAVETASVTGRISQVESLLAKDDVEFRRRLFSVQGSWNDAVERKEKRERDRAEKFQATLVAHLAVVTDRLKKELARVELNKEVVECQASIKEWKDIHAKHAEDIEAKLAEAEKAFNDALVEHQQAYTNALAKLCDAKDAVIVLEARRELVESFGNYPEVKALKPLQISLEEARDVISVEPAAVKAFVKAARGGISQSEFDAFLKDSVRIIADSPQYYSLYGLVGKNDRNGKIVAVSKGKPDFERPSYETSWKITCEKGELMSFGRKEIVKELKAKDGADAVLMPSSDEMRTLVEVASRANITLGAFENEVLNVIKQHMRSVHVSGYIETERRMATYYNPVRGWMSPYRRVQFLAWYMRWLREDLKVMPNDRELMQWHDRLETLANPVVVDGIPEALAWICIWDDRVRRRMKECAELLNKMPVNWVERYRAIKAANRAFAVIEGWKVSYAGKVKFDPLDPKFVKESDAIMVDAPNVEVNHPLYVLRKVEDRLVLLRAFEPGKKSPWRMCFDVSRTKEGYVLGEPLYHVFAKGKYIDVRDEIESIAKKSGIDMSDKRLSNIPLFTNGGK